MTRRTTESNDLLDRAAIAMSGLCLIHCLALPVILLVVPMLEQVFRDHFHLQLLAFVLPFSTAALVLGYRRHRHTGLLLWGGVGMACLIIGATWAHNEVGPVADRVFTISGSLILAATHYVNSRLARRHRLSEP